MRCIRFAMVIRLLVLYVLLIISSLVSATTTGLKSPDPANLLNPIDLPEGVSAGDWKAIQAQMEAGKYWAYSDEAGGFVSSNPAHGVHKRIVSGVGDSRLQTSVNP